MGLCPISIIGLGLSTVSSLMRVPNPPARITTFIVVGEFKLTQIAKKRFRRRSRGMKKKRSSRAGTFLEQGLEFADVFQFGQFVSDELHAERGFDREHQVDVMDGIPAGNVVAR